MTTLRALDKYRGLDNQNLPSAPPGYDYGATITMSMEEMMSKVEAATAYKTTDDEIFKTIHEAEKHQTDLDLKLSYNLNHPVFCGNCGGSAGFDIVKEWLDENREAVTLYLAATEEPHCGPGGQ